MDSTLSDYVKLLATNPCESNSSTISYGILKSITNHKTCALSVIFRSALSRSFGQRHDQQADGSSLASWILLVPSIAAGETHDGPIYLPLSCELSIIPSHALSENGRVGPLLSDDLLYSAKMLKSLRIHMK